MVLSYSRDPFCCYVAAQDLGSFWDCHRRGFAHFGGVPAAIVYDQTKTVVGRHVGRGQATPLHPEAVAFAGHDQFAIRLCAPRRPQAKGRVERQVQIVRTHVLDGREFDSLGAMDQAFLAWLPHRRAAVHRTHGEVIAVRAERDRAALSPPPERPYVVCERHTRRVAKDCLVSFEASCSSAPGVRSGPASGWSCGSPGRGGDLVAGPPATAARHPPAGGPPRHLAGRPDPLGRAPGLAPAAATVHRRQRARARTSTAGPAHPGRAGRLGAAAGGPGPGRPPRPGHLRPGRRVGMSELPASRVREHAERLHLPHLGENLDALVARAEQATMGYLEFIDLVLEDEVGVREGRRFANALKLSGLPHHKSLDAFDFAFQPDLDARKVRDLAALEFVQAKANVVFLGPPGVGKTMLAIALAIAACQAGFSIYFTTLDDLVRNLKEAEASGRFAKKLQTYLKPAVLVVDEIGYLPLAHADANLVFQLIARRYERGSILATSNKAFSEWGSVFGDDVLASAILDRLLHH
jgi:DNA replication protein DnaC